MITECISEDCYELTENIGGLCPVCMGMAQKRAEMACKAAQDSRSGVLSDKTGDRWLDGNTAPKDGKQFLADIGYGFAVLVVWNGYHEEFVYATVQVDCVFDTVYDDTYFETESYITVERWMPMPGVK